MVSKGAFGLMKDVRAHRICLLNGIRIEDETCANVDASHRMRLDCGIRDWIISRRV